MSFRQNPKNSKWTLENASSPVIFVHVDLQRKTGEISMLQITIPSNTNVVSQPAGVCFKNWMSLNSHCKKQNIQLTNKTMVKKKKINSSERNTRSDSWRKCPICSRRFLKKELADYHAENHNKMRYICREPSCGQMFLVFWRLYKHYWQKHWQRVNTGKKGYYLITTSDRVRHDENNMQQRDEREIHQSNDILDANLEPEASGHSSGGFRDKNKIQDLASEREDEPEPQVHIADQIETVNKGNLSEDAVVLTVTEDTTSNEVQSVIDALLSNKDLANMLNENTGPCELIMQCKDFDTEGNRYFPTSENVEESCVSNSSLDIQSTEGCATVPFSTLEALGQHNFNSLQPENDKLDLCKETENNGKDSNRASPNNATQGSVQNCPQRNNANQDEEAAFDELLKLFGNEKTT